MMVPQLATVDVALNEFYGSNAQPYHQIPPKLKTKGSLIPEDKASQTISVSFSLRQAPLLNNTLKGELTSKVQFWLKMKLM